MEEVRLTLKKMIMNHIEKQPRGYASELAAIAGYSSNSGGFNKVLSQEAKEFDKIQSIIDIINHIWKDDTTKYMVKYSTEIDANKKLARNFLEYLTTSREFDALNCLLDRMEACSNKESQEWAKTYRLQYKYELCRTVEDYNYLLKEINQTHVNVIELKVYKKMLASYCLNQLGDYNRVKFLSAEIILEVEQLENEFIKEMYTIRSNEVMSYYYLRVNNNPVAARACADTIISSSAKVAFKAYAYFIKGYSYLFTSYEKTVCYLNKSMELYGEINREYEVKDLKEKIEFAHVYWDKLNKEELSFVDNHILFHIRKGKDMSLALNNKKETIDPALYLYLEGCNTKNEKKLILSLIKFIKKSDLFLANLAKIELLKNGYDEEILEEMVNMNS